HVGRGPQAESVSVAVLPGDLVGQRLGGKKKYLLLACKLRNGKPNIGEKSAGQNVYPFARDQLIGDTHGISRSSAVIARDHLKLLAEHTALAIDLVDRKLPALLVGIEKGGLRFITIELTDFDGGLCERARAGAGEHNARCGNRKQIAFRYH